MPPCKNNKKRSYTGKEPSPKGLGYCASGTDIGAKKKGRDKNTWIVEQTKTGSKRWVKVKNMKLNGKNYFILDNGNVPFMVNIDKKTASIYKRSINKNSIYVHEDKSFYQTLIKKYNFKEVFIGKSPLNEMTKYSGGYGKKMDGNSILIFLGNHRYVYVGSEIYEFSTDDTIKKYLSPVGNSTVPYPFAIGEKNIYFMLDKKYEHMDHLEGIDKKDAYRYFYDHRIDKTAKNIKKLKRIHKRI